MLIGTRLLTTTPLAAATLPLSAKLCTVKPKLQTSEEVERLYDKPETVSVNKLSEEPLRVVPLCIRLPG